MSKPPQGRFSRLPERILPEDMITTSDTRPVPDPENGHNTDREFLIRYGLFF